MNELFKVGLALSALMGSLKLDGYLPFGWWVISLPIWGPYVAAFCATIAMIVAGGVIAFATKK